MTNTQHSRNFLKLYFVSCWQQNFPAFPSTNSHVNIYLFFWSLLKKGFQKAGKLVWKSKPYIGVGHGQPLTVALNQPLPPFLRLLLLLRLQISEYLERERKNGERVVLCVRRPGERGSGGEMGSVRAVGLSWSPLLQPFRR